MKNRQTLREEHKLAKIILLGTIANPKLDVNSGRGTTELHVLQALKSDGKFSLPRVVELDRYLPVLDPKKPPKYLVFFAIVNGKLDPYHGRPVYSKGILKYLSGAVKLAPKSRIEALKYFFPYLSHSESTIAEDAFLEFAKSTDAEVGQVAQSLPADVIRKFMMDPKTPAERLNLYAFLLGAAGNQQDANLLLHLIDQDKARTRNALDGLLCGLIQLQPKVGWDRVVSILDDPKMGFLKRYGAARVLTFYHNWQPKKSRPQILQAMRVMLGEPEIADLALNDLRRWEIWDLTDQVLALHRNKDYDSPIARRAMLRYLLSCPGPDAKILIQQLRQSDAELIREIEQSLAFERTAKTK